MLIGLQRAQLPFMDIAFQAFTIEVFLCQVFQFVWS
jgi:hypothetical protein